MNRASYQKQAKLLQSLLIPLGPWHSVSMDFITSLPELQGYDAIFVMVRPIQQVNTHGANYRNCNHIRDCKAVSQCMVEASWVAKNDCVGSKFKIHKCILEELL